MNQSPMSVEEKRTWLVGRYKGRLEFEKNTTNREILIDCIDIVENDLNTEGILSRFREEMMK